MILINNEFTTCLLTLKEYANYCMTLLDVAHYLYGYLSLHSAVRLCASYGEYTMAASTKLSDYGLSDKMGFMPSIQPSKRLPGKAPVIYMFRNYEHAISHSHHIMATW